MPELPEVETVRRDLAQVLVGRQIKAVEIRRAATVLGVSIAFRKKIIGARIKNVERRGKLLILLLSTGDALLFHLKMTGQLIFCNHKTVVAGGRNLPEIGALPNKWTHLLIKFDRGTLFFNDQRQFGYSRVVNKNEMEKIKAKYGVEPLSAQFKFAEFAKNLARRTTAIKALLMKQEFIAGIGNIYADEICFAAKVRPTRHANSLSLTEQRALFSAIKKILTSAIKFRGTTFSDYVDGAGKSGGFSKKLKVYDRAHKKCLRCGGIISKIRVGGRGTHFCTSCQK